MLDYYDQNKHICDVEKIVQWLQSRTAHVYMTLFMKSYTTPYYRTTWLASCLLHTRINKLISAS